MRKGEYRIAAWSEAVRCITPQLYSLEPQQFASWGMTLHKFVEGIRCKPAHAFNEE